MVRAAADQIGPLASAQTALLLSIGDSFGPASLEFLLAEAGRDWTVIGNGRERTVSFFSDGRIVTFPAPIGHRRAYRASSADQHFYPETFGVQTAAAWLAIEPPWVCAGIAALMRVGMGRWVARENVRAAIRRVVPRLHGSSAGGDCFALVVEAQGQGRTFRATLGGRVQAEATAVASSLFARALLVREIARGGVWFPEEVVDPIRFFERLREYALGVEQTIAAALDAR